jgi:flagellar biosynthetic protein FliR
VNIVGSHIVLASFVLFCRIGSCLMLMPGVSNARVPVRVRLLLVVAVTLALTPLLSPLIEKTLLDSSPLVLARLLFSEILTGLLIGFLGRIFFSALEALGIAIAQLIGLSGALGSPVQEGEPMPAIASLIVLAATILLFVMDLHWEILRAIIASYNALPVTNQFDFQFGLIQVSDTLAKSFLLALRVSSPFIVFSLIVNFAIGITSKMTPQIPVYFIMVPVVLGGGLFLLYGTFRQILELFMFGFQEWLRVG